MTRDISANSQDGSSEIPDGTRHELNITDLVPLEKLQKIQDCFAEATGVASIITDINGVPITHPSNFCRLCSEIIRKTEKGLCNCMHSDAELGKKNPSGPIMQPCLSGGLWDGGASICVGDRHIANWLIGQVRNEDLPSEKMMDYAHEIGADEEAFRSALAEVKIMPTAQFAKVCETLFLFANQISDLAYNNLALRQSESNLKTTLDSIGDAVIATDLNERVVRMNPVAERLTGWPRNEAFGKKLSEVFIIIDAVTRHRDEHLFDEVIRSGQTVGLGNQAVLIDRMGSERRIADSAAPIRGAGGEIMGMVLVFRDVNEQLRMEEQLRHSQKMDAIGQLAGGVAHDFNNMLAGIMGAADLLSRKLGDQPELYRLVKVILDATEKAAGLTRKLLDFSRKGKSESIPVDLHNTISAAIGILERSIDRKINIVTEFNANYPTVLGDPAQLQSAIMNLAINARDAMPEGGELKISTINVSLNANDSRLFADEILPGNYIEISVSDTGTGMSPETQKRIFEPFFTTKEVGKGTGLGLAAVYGMIKNHKGAIHVYSEPQKGTQFKIYLPLAHNFELEYTAEPTPVPPQEEGQGAKVLLVDDEPLIRSMAELILSDLGYEVMQAEDGLQAVEIIKEQGKTIDLIILDMIMPRMNGRDAFFAIRAIEPEIPVIFSSGFTHNQSVGDLLGKPNVFGFIQKPYRAASLGEAVAAAVSGKKSG